MVTAAPAVHDPLDVLLRRGAGPSADRIPLVGMEIDVDIHGGLAIVRCSRFFRNSEAVAIEATVTFPVPFDAVLTDLVVEIDGRKLVAAAQPRLQAREAYEDGLARGKLSVLHEEHLRGIHMLSVGQIGPGQTVTVRSTFVTSLSFASSIPGLRIPMTVGELYGRSPLPPSDDLETSADVVHRGLLRVTCDSGRPIVAGGLVADGQTPFALNRPIDISVEGWLPLPATGSIADGRRVAVNVAAAGGGSQALSLALLVDVSGSTADRLRESGLTINEAIRNALPEVLGRDLSVNDEVALWEFESSPRRIDRARGAARVSKLARSLRGPQGGTELGPAVTAALSRDDMRDVLVITDGQTHAAEVSALAQAGRRISVILVGDSSLEGRVGDLAGSTGGQIFVVRGADVGEALRAAIGSLRLEARPAAPGTADRIPDRFDVARGGARLDVTATDAGAGEPVDPVGRYVAALSLPALAAEAQLATSLAHGLVNHLTSLVVVDEVGATQEGLPEFRKVPLMAPAAAVASFDIEHLNVMMRSRSLDTAQSARQPVSEEARPLPLFAAATKTLKKLWFSDPSAGEDGTGLDAATVPPASALDAELGRLAGRIDWAALTPALLREDLSGLPDGVRDAILALAASSEVRHLWHRQGDDSPILFVLRLLAEREASANRHAARFAKAAAPSA